jgi:hypothetical protein
MILRCPRMVLSYRRMILLRRKTTRSGASFREMSRQMRQHSVIYQKKSPSRRLSRGRSGAADNTVPQGRCPGYRAALPGAWTLLYAHSEKPIE